MKKILMVAAVAMLGVVALSSCKKEKDCKCTEANTDYTTTQTIEGDCSELEDELNNQGGSLGQDWTCE